jgi:hypothetical protein
MFSTPTMPLPQTLAEYRSNLNHTVTIMVSSDAPMAKLRYLVLSSHNGGHQEVIDPPWSVTVPATGHGYLAAIGVQAGRDGTGVSCTITIDGKVASQRTVQGAYQVAVCFA